MNGGIEILKKIKLTVPQSGLPEGRILDVINILRDGTVVGMEANNDNNYTLYYVSEGEYDVVE